MTDDEGVLGNLPRSRPGKRSDKRDSAGRPAKTAGTAAAKAEAGGKAAAKAPRASRARPRTKAGASADPPRPQPSGDPLSGVLRTAATVAATGVRVAGAVTHELLRRLPRR